MKIQKSRKVGLVHRRSGFSFVELLVVLAVITLLVGMAAPALIKAREAARATQCRNNLKNISLGMLQFHDTYKRFPASGNFGHGSDGNGYRLHSWAVSILPYIDQQNLFEKLDLNVTLSDPKNVAIQSAQVPLYLCPIDITRNKEKFGDLSYAVNGGVGFTHYYQGKVRDCPIGLNGQVLDLNGDGSAGTGDAKIDDLDRVLFKRMGLFFLETWNTDITKRHYEIGQIQDGTSQTFLVAENVRTGFRPDDPYGNFSDPNPQHSAFYVGVPCKNNSCVDGSVDYSLCSAGKFRINSGLWSPEGQSSAPNSFHDGGVFMAYADGHVKFLSEQIDSAVYGALASPQGLLLDKTNLQQTIVSDSAF